MSDQSKLQTNLSWLVAGVAPKPIEDIVGEGARRMNAAQIPADVAIGLTAQPVACSFRGFDHSVAVFILQ